MHAAVVARGGELARPRVDAAHGAQARAEAPRAAARAAHVVACAEIASVSHRPSRARPARKPWLTIPPRLGRVDSVLGVECHAGRGRAARRRRRP